MGAGESSVKALGAQAQFLYLDEFNLRHDFSQKK